MATLEVKPGFVQVGNDVVALPAAGSLIELDGRRLGEQLVACECPEFAAFRFPPFSLHAVTGCVGPACEVEITAKKVLFRPGGCWVRVAVTFVGDGEPSTKVGGFMKVIFA